MDIQEFIQVIKNAENKYNKALKELTLHFPEVEVTIKIEDNQLSSKRGGNVLIKTSVKQKIM